MSTARQRRNRRLQARQDARAQAAAGMVIAKRATEKWAFKVLQKAMPELHKMMRYDESTQFRDDARLGTITAYEPSREKGRDSEWEHTWGLHHDEDGYYVSVLHKNRESVLDIDIADMNPKGVAKALYQAGGNKIRMGTYAATRVKAISDQEKAVADALKKIVPKLGLGKTQVTPHGVRALASKGAWDFWAAETRGVVELLVSFEDKKGNSHEGSEKLKSTDESTVQKAVNLLVRETKGNMASAATRVKATMFKDKKLDLKLDNIADGADGVDVMRENKLAFHFPEQSDAQTFEKKAASVPGVKSSKLWPQKSREGMFVVYIEAATKPPREPMERRQEAHDWLIKNKFVGEPGSSRYWRGDEVGRIEDSGRDMWKVTVTKDPELRRIVEKSGVKIKGATNPEVVRDLKQMGILPESESPSDYPPIGQDDTWESLEVSAEVKKDIIATLIKQGKTKLANQASKVLTARRRVTAAQRKIEKVYNKLPGTPNKDIFTHGTFSNWDGKLASVYWPFESDYSADDFVPEDLLRLYVVHFVDDGKGKPLKIDNYWERLVGQNYNGAGGNKFFGSRSDFGAGGRGFTGEFLNSVTFGLKIKLKDMGLGEARTYVGYLEKLGYIDASDAKVSTAMWKKFLTAKTWDELYAMDPKTGSANEAYKLIDWVLKDDSDAVLKKVKGVFSVSKKGKVKFVVPPPKAGAKASVSATLRQEVTARKLTDHDLLASYVGQAVQRFASSLGAALAKKLGGKVETIGGLGSGTFNAYVSFQHDAFSDDPAIEVSGDATGFGGNAPYDVTFRLKNVDYKTEKIKQFHLKPADLASRAVAYIEEEAQKWNELMSSAATAASNPEVVDELKTMGILPGTESPSDYPPIGQDDTWESLNEVPAETRKDLIATLLRAGKPDLANAAAKMVMALKLSPREKSVILAFIGHEAQEGRKLSTDGKRLDGLWMGGRGIAEWEGGKIHFTDLGSRAAQTVQKAIKKMAAPNDIAASTKAA